MAGIYNKMSMSSECMVFLGSILLLNSIISGISMI